MGRSHKKRIGFHEIIMRDTEVIKNNENLIITSVNIKEKKLQYCISTEIFLKYADMFYEAASKMGELTHKEAVSMGFTDLYKKYKTKMATECVSHLILNALVKGKIFYSDNGEDYYLLGNYNNFIVYLKTVGVI